MTRLIINADDFGQTKGVNAGIIEAHQEGILTSATLMANGAAFDEAVQLSREYPALGVGVHLNLVEGRPVCGKERVKSLLGHSGEFVSKLTLVRRHVTGQLRLDELRQEVEAQIDQVLAAGISATHVDSHKHIHTYPAFFRVVAEVAASRGIGAIRLPFERLRIADWLACPNGWVRTSLLNGAAVLSRRLLRVVPLATTDVFAGTLRTGAVTADWLQNWIRRLSGGTAELMVHPGYCDDELFQTGTRLTTHRETELAALLDSNVAEAISQRDIQLIHYGHFSENAGVVFSKC